MKIRTHLTGHAHPPPNAGPTSKKLADVTCEACREFIRTIGLAHMRARRQGGVPWLEKAKEAKDKDVSRPMSDAERRAAKRQELLRTKVVEENDLDGPHFHRFDLWRWLEAEPGDYAIVLRVRPVGEKPARVVTNRRLRCGDQLGERVAAHVRRDDEDGLLPEILGEGAGNAFRSTEESAAAPTDRGLEKNLDDDAILRVPLPRSAGADARVARERAPDHAPDPLLEVDGIDRRREPLVTRSPLFVAGNARADVETDGARRLEVATRAEASAGEGSRSEHEERIPPTSGSRSDGKRGGSLDRSGLEALDARVSRTNGRFYLYGSIDPATGALTLETSWLPDWEGGGPASVNLLAVRGFARDMSTGRYRITLSADEQRDDLRMQAIARAVFRALLSEGYM